MVDPATIQGNQPGSGGDEVRSVMVRVHGVAMIIGLSIFGVIGIFFAAWMKPVLVHGWWYKVRSGTCHMALTDIHIHVHTHAHSHMHTHTCTHTCTLTHAYLHTHSHAHSHMHTHIYTLTHAHSHTHSHAHSHMHTHT